MEQFIIFQQTDPFELWFLLGYIGSNISFFLLYIFKKLPKTNKKIILLSFFLVLLGPIILIISLVILVCIGLIELLEYIYD